MLGRVFILSIEGESGIPTGREGKYNLALPINHTLN